MKIELLPQSGIYAILNKVTGKRYIGSAVSLSHRTKLHLYKLKLGTHPNLKLQNSWTKHKEYNFSFCLVELVTKEFLLQREQYWIDFYNAVENGYNINPVAGSSRGTKRGPRSKETKAKISAAQKGKKLSEGHKAALKAAHVGMTGKSQSEYFKQKMSDVHSGKIVSEETRAKLSQAATGRKIQRSPEYCANIAERHARNRRLRAEAYEKAVLKLKVTNDQHTAN
jgi:group I intron endonuclease